MKNEENIIDWRSTGRRKARRALYREYISYECIDCGVTSSKPPKDAPEWFTEIWPVMQKLLQGKVIDSQLQADHETKDYTINDASCLNWRCPSCHKIHDSQTEKGESTIKAVEYY